jgi:hypothetical protein
MARSGLVKAEQPKRKYHDGLEFDLQPRVWDAWTVQHTSCGHTRKKKVEYRSFQGSSTILHPSYIALDATYHYTCLSCCDVLRASAPTIK